MDTAVSASTPSDLDRILRWLQEEDDRTGQGFWCNRSVVEACHRDGELSVVREHGEAVGLLAGRIWAPDILEVRPDRRGRGYGRLLAGYFVTEADRLGMCMLQIECQPASSIPFWEAMGFELLRDDRETRLLGGHACRVLGRRHPLPAGPLADVRIELFPEARNWDPTVEPILSKHLEAARRPDGRHQLSERVVLFSPRVSSSSDEVVRIVVEGREVFLDKVKRDAAKHVGVEQDHGGTYYLDAVGAPL